MPLSLTPCHHSQLRFRRAAVISQPNKRKTPRLYVMCGPLGELTGAAERHTDTWFSITAHRHVSTRAGKGGTAVIVAGSITAPISIGIDHE